MNIRSAIHSASKGNTDHSAELNNIYSNRLNNPREWLKVDSEVKLVREETKQNDILKVLEQKHKNQKQFIYMIIHDLRSPINAIERSLNQA